VPKLDVPRRLPAKQGEDDLKLAALTRDDVAKRLGVSVSTMRRLEGTRLHPLLDDKSVRRLKAASPCQALSRSRTWSRASARASTV
jgi:predicted transcriptional regulator